MTNSDYLIRATVKKLSEKFNQTFLGKIEDAANAAQEVPEIIKKEFEALKDEIIKEAQKMETEYEQKNPIEEETITKGPQNMALMKIDQIKKQLEMLNQKLDN
tara:strand:- start:47 stop:355 length:309 start_codon:yes stop_codon:yes gene_type:complete